MKSQRLISAIGLLLFGIAVFLYAATFPDENDGYPGPGAFPQVLSALVALCGLGLFFLREKPSSSTSETEEIARQAAYDSWFSGWQRLLLGIVIIALVPILIDYIEFIPILAGVCLAIVIILDRRPLGILRGLLVACLTAAFVYLIFTYLLGVQL